MDGMALVMVADAVDEGRTNFHHRNTRFETADTRISNRAGKVLNNDMFNTSRQLG
jgi:hypothetical protein